MPRLIAVHTVVYGGRPGEIYAQEEAPRFPERGMRWIHTYCDFSNHKHACEWEAPNKSSLKAIAKTWIFLTMPFIPFRSSMGPRQNWKPKSRVARYTQPHGVIETARTPWEKSAHYPQRPCARPTVVVMDNASIYTGEVFQKEYRRRKG